MALTNHIVPDSPTNNFATLNPLLGTTGTFSNGNLNVAGSGSTKTGTIAFPSSGKYYYESMIGGVTSGYPVIGIVSIPINATGYVHSKQAAIRPVGSNSDRPEWVIDGVDREYDQISSTALAANDIIQVIYDADNGKVWFGINNTYYGVSSGSSTTVSASNIANGINPAYVIDTNYTYIPMVNTYSTSEVAKFNFGQDPTFGGASNLPTGAGDYDTDAAGNSTGGRFAFQPPTGALALCTANLPDFTPTVTGDVPQDYFKTVLYTGQTADSTFVDNGDNTWSKTGVGFQPDLVWIKKRSASAGHILNNSVVGVGSGTSLYSNTSDSKGSYDDYGYLNSLDSDGFTTQAGTDATYPNDLVNASNETYVAWCWKAGGAPTADNTATSGAMNANGSAATSSNSSVSLNGILQSNYTPAGSPTIYPTRMSINTNAGFSIVKYVGDGSTNNSSPATVPSGLSDVDVVLVKNLDYGSHPNQANNVCTWQVYHKSLSSNHTLVLNGTHAEYDIAVSGGGGIQINNGNLQLITRTTTVTWNANVNDSGDNYIAYCWHSVEGYSKFGSYTGNGSADGPFVYCGFRPAFILFKSADIASNWEIYDTARQPHNPALKPIYANLPSTEEPHATLPALDILSNGFKPRSTWDEFNRTDTNYIYMAFAEQPFKFSNAR
jgi:hypothetical protein